MGVARYLSIRIGLAIVTLVLISLVTFIMTNAVPSDPARIALGRFATPEQLEVFREQQGLDKPLATRYVSWAGNLLEGDWGTSTLTRREVRGEVVPRITRTAIVGLAAMLLALPFAVALGVYTGQRAGKPVDIGISLASLFLNSLPEFVTGIILLVCFAVLLPVLPVESSGVAYGEGFAQVEAYILPTLTLTLVLMPYMVRMMRVNVRDIVGQPFVRSAVLRGLPRGVVTWRHIFPNASLPVVNVVALNFAELLGGFVVVETLFGFPGIGKLFVDSVLSKDIATVQACALLMGIGFVVLNFAADSVVLLLNPRLRTR
jgi:peptide/nickel transport system permease protein